MFQVKKLLVLILALLMVLTAFTACGESGDGEDESTTPGTGTETETETETETDSESKPGSESESDSETTPSGSESESDSESESETDPNIGSAVTDTFPDEVLEVLSWKASNITEYELELTDTSTVVQQAVYNRCDLAETQLGLRTRWNLIAGTGSDTDFIETADRENSNGGKYHMIVNVSSFAHSLTTRGVYSNLKNYDYFDNFSHPAWPDSLLDDITVGNKLYFATGDISTNLIFMTSVVFFNKDLVEDLMINEKIQENWDAADLYELVTTGRWTLDKMITLCEDTWLDVDESGTKSSGDRFGLNTYNTLLDNFYYGGGYTTIVSDSNGFSISPDFFNSTLMGGILSQVNALLHDSNDGFYEGGSHANTQKNFANGNVLFSLAPASHAYHTHSNTEDLNYSVLPVPKHSESQTKYACTQSFPYSVYAVASQSKNPAATAAFIQVLAEQSYEVTRPALFDKMMKGRYAEDPEDAEMWEYAVDANVFDVGRVFCEAFGKDRKEQLTVNLFRNCIIEESENWAGVLSTYAIPLATYVANLKGEIEAIPD